MKTSFIIISLLMYINANSQVKVHTSDIDNYWQAYDSIITTHDFTKRLNLINKLYINKGTKGLKAFMEARRYRDTLYVKHIEAYPEFWKSIRPNTLTVKSKTNEILETIARLKELYPKLKPAELYFTIGGFRSAGTVDGNMVLVGCEIATGTPDINLSEFKNPWLKGVFAKQDSEHIIPLTIHEYIHTQQKKAQHKNVLGYALSEGSADFITELVMGKPIVTSFSLMAVNMRQPSKKVSEKKCLPLLLSDGYLTVVIWVPRATWGTTLVTKFVKPFITMLPIRKKLSAISLN